MTSVFRPSSWLVRAVLVAVIVLSTARGGFLPAFARLAGGPPVHACHCEVRGGHSTCACPRCNAELRDDADADAYGALRTTCGDDADATLGKAFVSALPAGVSGVVRVGSLVPGTASFADDPSILGRSPESPPPRASNA